MQTINRAVAIIKPRQPYLDWARAVPEPIDLSLDDVRQDCTAVLLPDVADAGAAEAYLRSIAHEIFAAELAAWTTDLDTWPADRGYATFQAWFEIEIHSLVLDTVKTPIRRARFEPG